MTTIFSSTPISSNRASSSLYSIDNDGKRRAILAIYVDDALIAFPDAPWISEFKQSLHSRSPASASRIKGRPAAGFSKLQSAGRDRQAGTVRRARPGVRYQGTCYSLRAPDYIPQASPSPYPLISPSFPRVNINPHLAPRLKRSSSSPCWAVASLHHCSPGRTLPLVAPCSAAFRPIPTRPTVYCQLQHLIVYTSTVLLPGEISSLVAPLSASLTMSAYVDSDYAGNATEEARRSTSHWLRCHVCWWSNLLVFQARLQASTLFLPRSASSSEAEYYALTECIKELCYLQQQIMSQIGTLGFLKLLLPLSTRTTRTHAARVVYLYCFQS